MMRIALSIAVAIGAAAASGCGASGGTVSGVVTLEGKPVERATVSFLSVNGNVVSATTDASGKYSVDGVPGGATQVTVAQIEGGIHADGGESIKKTKGGAAPLQSTTIKNKLPGKYANFDSSGLKFDVKGDTTFDIPLKN